MFSAREKRKWILSKFCMLGNCLDCLELGSWRLKVFSKLVTTGMEISGVCTR